MLTYFINNPIKSIFKNIDWVLFSAVLLISFAGLVTMNSFVGNSSFFERQSIWLIISILVFFIASFIDGRFLKILALS